MPFTSPFEDTLHVGGSAYRHASLALLADRHPPLRRLPKVLKILAEITLRRAPAELPAYLDWVARGGSSPQAVQFWPARVLTHDSTCVPAFVDFAALRDAAAAQGLDPAAINPVVPVDVVIDHSITVDRAGSADALLFNMRTDVERNRERYALIRWAGRNLKNVTVTPPGFGIAHQVNLERLASVVQVDRSGPHPWLLPDTLVASDSHTPMVSGLSVLAWGVGGLDMQMAALGKPLPMRLPGVVGVRLSGQLRAGVTAADLAYTLVRVLRDHGVIDHIVEFFGPGMAGLSVPDRATLANMAPEYGATTGFFPTDDATLDYLRLTGRSAEQLAIVQAYTQAQGLWFDPAEEPLFTSTVAVDLTAIETTLAGPRNPAERVTLRGVPQSVEQAITRLREGAPGEAAAAGPGQPGDGAILIAAITSCTTTANPQLMAGAGLLARNARRAGLAVPWWVRTSLSPGSRPTAGYLAASGLQDDLDALGFQVTGFGCMTCIGNSGELAPAVTEAVRGRGLLGAAVLSGNRNFEGRIHPDVKMAYLAAPALVVAYALAGTVCRNLETEPLGTGHGGKPVYLADVWPSREQIAAALQPVLGPALFARAEADNQLGFALWDTVPSGGDDALFAWSAQSTYLRRPPYLDGMRMATPVRGDIHGARALLVLGDRVTTDHISPAGSIAEQGLAGQYLREHGVARSDFNQFNARRGNHEVMVRGGFSNPGLDNELLADVGRKGGYARVQPAGDVLPVHDAALAYAAREVPLLVIAGKEYGSGSSRDWAAKATALLGVQAVVAESFERIHRSNLVAMGVLPMVFADGLTRHDLALGGAETFDILGLGPDITPDARAVLRVHRPDGRSADFPLIVKVDTQAGIACVHHGGVLPQTLRELRDASEHSLRIS